MIPERIIFVNRDITVFQIYIKTHSCIRRPFYYLEWTRVLTTSVLNKVSLQSEKNPGCGSYSRLHSTYIQFPYSLSRKPAQAQMRPYTKTAIFCNVTPCRFGYSRAYRHHKLIYPHTAWDKVCGILFPSFEIRAGVQARST